MGINEMSYEDKEAKLTEILDRLDKSETPVDKLVEEAREAAGLITAMNSTLKGAKKELTDVFAEMEKMKAGQGE